MSAAEDTDTSMGAAAEQAADLAALQAAAAGAEPAPGAVAEAEAQAIAPPSAAAMQIAALAVGILQPVITFAVPSLREAPAELWQPVPEGVAAVLDHYGAAPEWMQSPWARLGLSVMPLVAFAAVQAMKEPKPKAEPEAGAPLQLEAKAPDVVAGARTVSFGAPAAEAAA